MSRLDSGQIFRVAIDELGATEFSASRRERRFSPVLTEHGDVVAALYAAATIDAAIAETIFHDVDDDPDRLGAVLHAGFRRQRLSVLAPQRSLVLADLTDAELPRLGSSHEDLITTGPLCYPDTRRWGQWTHDNASEADGVMWNSRRDPARAISVMLFGDRVHRRDLVADMPTPLFEGPGYGRVLEVGARLNVTVVE